MEVSVDLDGVPGAFSTAEDYVRRIQHMLDQTIPHYYPVVSLKEGSQRDINRTGQAGRELSLEEREGDLESQIVNNPFYQRRQRQEEEKKR